VSKSCTFLLEIGTEEIPASYLEPALKALSDAVVKSLKDAGVSHGETRTMFTPRRLVVLIEDVASVNLKHTVEFQGPPAKVARDESGKWSKAAKKFAQKHGAQESQLFIKDTDKGSYVFVKKQTGGKKTADLLGEVLPGVILGLPFPRRMRWTRLKTLSFARPVRWLCALLGSEVVGFRFPELVPSEVTYGHRFAHPDAITINNPREYVQKLRDAYVIVDPEERRERIAAELEKAAKKLGGSLVADTELLAEVVNLVEHPNVLVCNLGGFMELPREVLQTALAKHQRAFVVERKGRLLPHFLVVTNAPKLEPDLVKVWFERMAVSRLEDADFFIAEDLAKGLEALVEEESRVEWIKGIGSLADKTRWLADLGLHLGGGIEGFDAEVYKRAAHLAKADLLTNLVREKEFTSLQGVAGAIYAERLGEPPGVCQGIREQYTDSPTTLESAILGVADRLLNICAVFAAGKPPKGSRDPFALRRQAGAVTKVLIEHHIHADIPALIEKTFELFGKRSGVRLRLGERGDGGGRPRPLRCVSAALRVPRTQQGRGVQAGGGWAEAPAEHHTRHSRGPSTPSRAVLSRRGEGSLEGDRAHPPGPGRGPERTRLSEGA